MSRMLSYPSSYANIGIAAIMAVLATAITAHDVAVERGGPGVTCDELYHIGYGKRLVSSLLRHGPHFFTAECIKETFAWSPDGPPVHPPLGNWILGWVHWLFDPDPHEVSQLAITPARLGSAICFGILVFFVSWMGIDRYGLVGGIAAGSSLMLMPRLFGHAHLAALDTVTTLTCTVTVLTVVAAEKANRSWAYLLAGLVWGLALLTRFHGLLCAPPILLWIFWQKRAAGLLPALYWCLGGILMFLAGWPWLWVAPLSHLMLYLATSTHRTAIHVFYWGRVWDDVFVPWHYPWLMFVVTIPVGLLFLGVVPFLQKWILLTKKPEPASRIWALIDGADFLFLGVILFFLAVFTGPRVPVYDGVRLFLPVYPMWALLVGRGTQVMWEWLLTRSWTRNFFHPLFILGTFFIFQAVGIVWFRPVWLSYYNLLVGGLAGAERLGFEVNYWGDALHESLLAEAAERMEKGGVLAFGPSLAPYQGAGILIGSRALAEKEIVVAGWPSGSATPPKNARYLVIYHRRADLDQIPERYLREPPLSEVSCQGVWLARLVPIEEAP